LKGSFKVSLILLDENPGKDGKNSSTQAKPNVNEVAFACTLPTKVYSQKGDEPEDQVGA
jgi:hypothetical protein